MHSKNTFIPKCGIQNTDHLSICPQEKESKWVKFGLNFQNFCKKNMSINLPINLLCPFELHQQISNPYLIIGAITKKSGIFWQSLR